MTTVESLQTQINSVISLYSNGQIQEALDSVEILTKGYPDEPLLYNISGVCYKASGQLDAAVESFEKALAIKPDYTEVCYNLGIVFMGLGQLDEAVKSYEKALTLKPNYAEAHYNLGIAFKKLGQMDTAVECYEKAIAIQPNYAEAHNNLGNTFLDLGQLDAAIEYYKKALTVNPDYAEAHNNLGNALKDLGQLDEAAIEVLTPHAKPKLEQGLFKLLALRMLLDTTHGRSTRFLRYHSSDAVKVIISSISHVSHMDFSTGDRIGCTAWLMRSANDPASERVMNWPPDASAIAIRLACCIAGFSNS